MNEKTNKLEKIANGIFSYLTFLKNFKKVKFDDIISNAPEKKNSSKFTYVFRQFNLECYIIDKKYFDDFRVYAHFNELIPLLEPLNEGNKNKFKIELKKYLEKNPYKQI